MGEGGVGFDAGDLVAHLRIEASGFEQGLQEARGNLDAFAQDIGEMMGMSRESMLLLTQSLSGVAVGVAAVESAAFGAAVASAEWADNLKDIAAYSGMSTQSLERLRAVALGTGADYDSLSYSAIYLNRTLGNITTGTEPAAKAMHTLGINIKDANGNMKNSDVLFPAIIGRLHEIKDPAERAGLAMDLFGRNSKEVLKLAQEAPEALQGFSDAAKVHAQSQLDDAENFKNELAAIQAEFKSIWREVGLQLIPIVRQDLLPLMRDVVGVIKELAPLLEYAARGFHILGMTVVSVGDMVGSFTQMMWKTAKGDFKGAAEEMENTWKRTSQKFIDYRNSWQNDWNKAAQYQLELNNKGGMSNTDYTTSIEAITDSWKSATTALTDYQKAQKQVDTNKAQMDILDNKAKLQKYTTRFGSASEVTPFMIDEYNQTMGTKHENTYSGAAKATLEIKSIKDTIKAQEALVAENKKLVSAEAATGKVVKTNADNAVKGSAEVKAAKTDEVTGVIEQMNLQTEQLLLSYQAQEEMSLIHFTAMTEYVRISVENMTKNWYDFVVAVASNPAIANIGVVIWGKDGPDWNPSSNPEFMQTAKIAQLKATKIAYKKADFSAVQTLSAYQTKKTEDEKNKEGNTTKAGGVTVIVNNPIGKTDTQSVKQAGRVLASQAGMI